MLFFDDLTTISPYTTNSLGTDSVFEDWGDSTFDWGLPTFTRPPDSTPKYLLGDGMTIFIIVTTLILGTVSMTLNLSLMVFHSKKMKKSIVSFMYFILGLSDFSTGFCCYLHAVIFLIIIEVKEKLQLSIYLLIMPSYFLTVVAFKISALVSMLLAAVRTCNILLPSKKIRKRLIVATIVIFTLLWMLIFSMDVGLFMDEHLSDMANINGTQAIIMTHEYLIYSYFYAPKRAIWVELLASRLDMTEKLVGNCGIELTYSGAPFLACALVTIANTLFQLKFLLFPSEVSLEDIGSETVQIRRKEMRRSTVNIVLISSFFLSTASLSLYFPINTVCLNPDKGINPKISYSFGYLPFFLNAALNPVILVTRNKPFREFMIRKFLRVCYFRTGQRNTRSSIVPTDGPSVA